MINRIQVATVFVTDQDQALDFYTNTLGMHKKVDMVMGENFRWVEVIPTGAETSISLSMPFPGMPAEAIGGNTGMLFDTSDIKAAHQTLTAKGVEFIEEPAEQAWGAISAQFKDPFGNIYMLVERTN